MMNLKRISTLAIICLTLFVSCDEIDELTEFDATFTLEESISVAIEEDEDTTQTFSQSVTFNLAEDDDVADNLSAIEGVTINSLTYSFSNVSGNEEAEITDAQLTVGGTTLQLEAVNPSQAAGQTFTIANTAGLNAIASALQANPQTTVSYQGTVEGNPVSFTVNIELGVTVTIDPV